MPVVVHPPGPAPLSAAELAPWRKIPVAVAVDNGCAGIDPAIRPLRPPGQQPPLFGRAVTALCEPPDFGAVLHALEHVGEGDVLVIAAAGNRDFAMIGEILGGYLHRRGAVGIVCDGAVRDVAALAGLQGFAVFSRSITPRGPTAMQRGAVNVPVVIGGVLVSPGDLILGDDDGLVAVSRDAMRHHLAACEAKVARETEWIDALASGRSVKDTFGLP